MLDAAFEPLSEQECLFYMKNNRFGRLCVVTADGRPEIVPVNYALRGHTVIIATASRLVQSRAPLGHVAFEVDSIDPETHEGWDVIVKGEGADITDSVDTMSTAARDTELRHWVPGKKDFWLTIVNPEFSGRRLYYPVGNFF